MRVEENNGDLLIISMRIAGRRLCAGPAWSPQVIFWRIRLACMQMRLGLRRNICTSPT
jgi:hypothetical protein